MSEIPAAAAAPGWFPDPEDAAQLRYWDGTAWTEHRAPATAPAVAPYGGAPTAVAEGPVAVAPLLAAGALLIVAGIGRAVSYLAPYEAFAVTIGFSVVEVLGWAGAFLAFFVAGYPSRRTAPRVVTLVLVGIYVVSGVASIAATVDPYGAVGVFAILGLLGLATFGLGIAFSVSALRRRGLPRRIAVLPGILYAGLAVFGLAAGAANAATASLGAISSDAGLVIGGLSGLVPIVVGALFLAFGRTPVPATA